MNVTFIQIPVTTPDDNRIINMSYNATTIQVFTDQPSVCTINTSQDQISQLLTINYDLFDGEDDKVYEKYYTVHNYTVDYKGRGAIPGIYYYTINCTSLAQYVTSKTVPIIFAPNLPPPVANIVPNITRLALRSFDVTCTGLCMNTYQETYDYALIQVNDSCANVPLTSYTTANYTDSIILRNTTQICVKIRDVLGRVATTSLNVTMQVIDQGEMDINYPYAYYYLGVTDQVYAPSSSFTLNISTPVDSDCRYAPTSSLINLGLNSIQDMYNTVPGISDNYEFTKVLNGNVATQTVSSFRLKSIQNTAEDWMVICLVIDPNDPNPDSPIYIARELEFYWDDTAPLITSNVVPPRIYDWSTRQSAMLNVTTDDETRCALDLVNSTLTNNNNGAVENLNWNNLNTEMLDVGDTNLFTSYVTARQHTYSIQSKWLNNINTNNTYQFNISCWNRAMLAQRSVIPMLYDLERSVKINITSGNIFNGTTIPITAVTNIQSTCEATLGIGGGTQIMISPQNDGINHVTSFNSVSGSRIHIIVRCYVPDNTDITQGQVAYDVALDASPPTVNLSSTNNKDYTCGLNGFSINVDMTDDTGIDSYYYSISGPNIAASLNNVTSSDTHGVIYYAGALQDNGIYSVDVKAKDLSGKYSDVQTISITARSSSSSILCDNAIPVMSIALGSTPFLDMTTANVSCTDDTGCRPLYYYSFTTNSNCYNELYDNPGSYNDILTFNNDGLLCVKGQDLAGNTGYAQQNITIGIDMNNPFNITSIGLISPNVIVTNTTITNITLTTIIGAECRYSSTPTNNTNLLELFNNYRSLIESDGLTHIIAGFDTQGLYEQYIDVICYNSSVSNQSANQYSRKIIKIIYTAEVPTINAYADPELVYDWNSRDSLLTIDTVPETVCTITGNDVQNTPAPGYITGQYNNALTYSTEHKKELFYNVNTPASVFNYIITCRTLGSKEYTSSVNVTYNINNTLDIELLSPTIVTTSIVDLIVQTSLISNCSLIWQNVDEGEMLSNVTNRQHSYSINTTSDGLYTAEVKCSTPITGNYAIQNFSIRVNTSTSCGDGIITGTQVCNGLNLNGMSCTTGWVTTNYTGGILKCLSDCSGFDFSSCDNGNGYCGDDRLEGPNTQGMFEQCDLGISSGLSCEDFGFLGGGSLSCNNCIINTSNCRRSGNLLGSGPYSCNDNILEPGEQCEAEGNSSLTCTNFGYDGGSLSCNTCQYSMSACYFNTIYQSGGGNGCGNNIKDGNEQCDNMSGLSTVSCATLGNFSGGTVTCTKDCKYNLSQCISNTCTNGKKDNTESDLDCGGNCQPCGLNMTCFSNSDCASKVCGSLFKCVAGTTDTCNNNKFDNSSETDVDCGGTCQPCALDKNCLTNTDCASNFCTDGKCSVDICNNEVKDEGESDIDCGGNCTTCDVGKSCNVNADCSSDNCEDNVCAEAKPPVNPVKIPLLIIALVFMLGGGGYIIYKTFIEKKPVNNIHNNIGYSSQSMNTTSMMPVRPEKLTPEQEKIVQKQHEVILKKRQDRVDERKSVLQKLEESTNDDKKVELEESKKNNDNISDNENEEFVDISKIKDKKNIDEDQSKLSKSKEKKNIEDNNKDTFSKLKDIGKNENKAFDKLQKLDVDNVSKKISQISGVSQSTVKPTLNNTSKLGYADAIKLFGDVDRDMIMSGVFKEVLSQLLDSKKITREHVSNILFEYMDKGIITKSDVAKISSDLKII